VAPHAGKALNERIGKAKAPPRGRLAINLPLRPRDDDDETIRQTRLPTLPFFPWSTSQRGGGGLAETGAFSTVPVPPRPHGSRNAANIRNPPGGGAAPGPSRPAPIHMSHEPTTLDWRHWGRLTVLPLGTPDGSAPGHRLQRQTDGAREREREARAQRGASAIVEVETVRRGYASGLRPNEHQRKEPDRRDGDLRARSAQTPAESTRRSGREMSSVFFFLSRCMSFVTISQEPSHGHYRTLSLSLVSRPYSYSDVLPACLLRCRASQ
jgi:hypothetical protein